MDPDHSCSRASKALKMEENEADKLAANLKVLDPEILLIAEGVIESIKKSINQRYLDDDEISQNYSKAVVCFDEEMERFIQNSLNLSVSSNKNIISVKAHSAFTDLAHHELVQKYQSTEQKRESSRRALLILDAVNKRQEKIKREQKIIERNKSFIFITRLIFLSLFVMLNIIVFSSDWMNYAGWRSLAYHFMFSMIMLFQIIGIACCAKWLEDNVISR